jgi:hypothetical protein
LSHFEVNRRQFLGDSARNAAGMAVGVVGWSGAALGSAPSDRVRIGIVGVRSQGLELASALAAFRDAEVAALCDIDAGVLLTAQARIAGLQPVHPAVHQDFRRLLEDRSLDAVVIATPDHWHAPLTALACEEDRQCTSGSGFPISGDWPLRRRS